MGGQKRIAPEGHSVEDLRTALNQWRPYTGAGIRVASISADFREVTVELTLCDDNQNYFGTHFGGSLSAMTNPFYVLMLANILGPGYTVWDTTQTIRYIAPGRSTVRAHFQLNEDEIAEAKKRTANGEKYEPVFAVDIVDEAGKVIASVEQTLYNPPRSPAAIM